MSAPFESPSILILVVSLLQTEGIMSTSQSKLTIGNLRSGKDRKGLRSHIEAKSSIREVSWKKLGDYRVQIVPSPAGTRLIILLGQREVAEILCEDWNGTLRSKDKRRVGRAIYFYELKAGIRKPRRKFLRVLKPLVSREDNLYDKNQS